LSSSHSYRTCGSLTRAGRRLLRLAAIINIRREKRLTIFPLKKIEQATKSRKLFDTIVKPRNSSGRTTFICYPFSRTALQ